MTAKVFWVLAVGGLVGFAAFSSRRGRADEAAAAPVPDAVALKFDQALEFHVTSKPLPDTKPEFFVIGVGKGTFHLADDGRLTAKLSAGVHQHARVDYWIYATVFDGQGHMLGTASHKEEVQYIRLGREPLMFREIALDFGISKSFKNAAYVVVTISDRDMPEPLSGKG